MLRFQSLIAAVVPVICVFAQPGLATAVEDPVFVVLPAEFAATTMTLTEDGLYLLVAHEDVSRVTVWDVKAGTLVKTIESPSPRHILCVGDRVYVANYGKGTISVYSGAPEWSIVDQLLVGHDEVYYLSAPQGKYFDDTILATCGKYTAHQVRSVDVKRDVNELVLRETYMSVATVDYTGQYVIKQGEINHSPSATVSALRYDELLKARQAQVGRGEHTSTPILRQTAESSFWFGGSQLFSGTPPKVIGESLGKYAIPDQKGGVVYALKDETIEAIKLDMTLPTVASRPISYPEDIAKSKRRARSQGDAFVHPQAVRHGDDVYVFLKDGPRVCRAVFPGLMSGVTIHMATTSLESAAEEASGSELPEQIVEGEELSYALFGDDVEGQFTVVTGSENASVASSGVLTWTPTADDVGSHRFKVRATINGETSFARFTIEVISANVADKLEGDLSKLESLGRHYISEQDANLATVYDGSAVLLQSGRNLRVLDADGQLVLKTHDFERPYQKMLRRKDYFVGLAGSSVDLIHPITMGVTKHCEVPRGRCSDMVLHPEQRLCYVAVTDSGSSDDDPITSQKILCLNETTGEFSSPRRAYGQWLAIHPCGTMLYSAIKHTGRSGYAIDPYWGDLRVRYEHLDVLVSYRLSGQNVTQIDKNSEPGVNGRCLVIAPDGAEISYVAGGGYQSGPSELCGYTIPAFDSKDIQRARQAYNVGAYPQDMSFHPKLRLVAATEGKSVQFFNRDTGERVDGKLAVGEGELEKITQVFFTPGGRHLMVDYTGADKRRVMHSIPLVLSAEEEKLLEAPLEVATPSTSEDDESRADAVLGPTLADLEQLTEPNQISVTTQEIYKTYADAVVVIETDSGGGTGFFVTDYGHVLTCAHVVPKLGSFTVSYRGAAPGDPGQRSAEASVVAIDDEKDLALLKVYVEDAVVKTVQFEQLERLVGGEDVSVIANPGLGQTVLDYTMTKGIVSNTSRMIEGRPYIQTTAAVNPGSSGAPLFNGRGNVVGLVLLKATVMESTGFAVPVEDLYGFLLENASQAE